MLHRAWRAISVDCVVEYPLGLFHLVIAVHLGLEISSLCRMLKLKLELFEAGLVFMGKTGLMVLGLANSGLIFGKVRTLIDFGWTWGNCSSFIVPKQVPGLSNDVVAWNRMEGLGSWWMDFSWRIGKFLEPLMQLKLELECLARVYGLKGNFLL